MRGWLGLGALIAMLAVGCGDAEPKRTQFFVRIEADNAPASIARIDLEIERAAGIVTVPIQPSAGAPPVLTLPLTREVQLDGDETGAVVVTAIARDGAGSELSRGREPGTIIAGETLTLVLVFGRDSVAEPQPLPQHAELVLTPVAQDFGLVALGASADATFTVENRGDGDSGALEVHAAGDFAVVGGRDDCAGQPLVAGSACTVLVRFAPTLAGARGGTLTISGAPGGEQPAALTGTGVTRGALELTPPSHAFGGQLVGGASAAASFTVRNSGDTPTGALEVALGGSQAADFEVATSTCGPALAGGASCIVSVRLRPSSAGAKTASLSISASPGGVAPAALTGAGLAPARLTATPASHSFGTVDLTRSSAALTWTVTNAGDVDSTAPVLSATGDADFTTVSGCTAVLAPRGSCTVQVSFAPTQVGARSGRITISAGPSSAALALTGTGRGPNLLQVSTTGGGSVTSQPAGISCGSDCSESYLHGTAVDLSASAPAGVRLLAWGGACASVAATTSVCRVTLDAARDVTVSFEAIRPVLTVVPSGPVEARITADQPRIECSQAGATGPEWRSCVQAYPYGQVVNLRAGAGGSWTGCDQSDATTCRVTMTADRTVSYRTVQPVFTVTIDHTLYPFGAGSLVSIPAGLSCWPAGSLLCPASFTFTGGTAVTFRAGGSSSYQFRDWGATPCASVGGATGNECSMTINSDVVLRPAYQRFFNP